MATVDLIDEATGEVTTIDPAEVARELADAIAEKAAVDREIAELRADGKKAQERIDAATQTLLAAAEPGQAWMVPGGHVAIVHGPRRNSTINRDGCDQYAEELSERGLLEITHIPAPPPKITYPKVSALRSAEAELAVAGIPVAALVNEGGPGEPQVVCRADREQETRAA